MGHNGTKEDETHDGAAGVDDHAHWWIARTGRRAACNACALPIPAWEIKRAFHPDDTQVIVRRRWGRAWWSNYRINSGCLGAAHSQAGFMRARRPVAARMCIYCAPMPRGREEAPEQYRAAQDAGVERLLDEYQAAFR